MGKTENNLCYLLHDGISITHFFILPTRPGFVISSMILVKNLTEDKSVKKEINVQRLALEFEYQIKHPQIYR